MAAVLSAKKRLLNRVRANGVSRTYSISSSSSSFKEVDEFCDDEVMKRMVKSERMVASLSKLVLAILLGLFFEMKQGMFKMSVSKVRDVMGFIRLPFFS